MSVWVEKFRVIGTAHLIELHFVYVHVVNPECQWLSEVSMVSALSEDLWTVSPNHLDHLGDRKKFHDQEIVGVEVLEKGNPTLKPLQGSRGTLDVIWIQTLLFPLREISELLIFRSVTLCLLLYPDFLIYEKAR